MTKNMEKKRPIKGERRVMICKATGKPIDMEYVGNDGGETGEFNGHPGWLCLHDGR